MSNDVEQQAREAVAREIAAQPVSTPRSAPRLPAWILIALLIVIVLALAYQSNTCGGEVKPLGPVQRVSSHEYGGEWTCVDDKWTVTGQSYRGY